MTNMVLGFRFNPKKDKVVLIEKKRPIWQGGDMNGIGGHVERTEHFPDAMEREFYEETGLFVSHAKWTQFVTLTDKKLFKLHCFYSFGAIDAVRSTTDEEVFKVTVSSLGFQKLVKHIDWLVPMAREKVHITSLVVIRGNGQNARA